MAEIRLKKSMSAPKARRTDFTPKSAEDIRRGRVEEKSKRRPKAGDPVRYAVGKAEEYGGITTYPAARVLRVNTVR